MSIFTPGANDQGAPVVPETPEAILDAAKAKFKNEKGELDVVGLAKGKLESDAFIINLTGQMEALRQDLNSRTSLEELLQDLKASRQPASNPAPQASVNESNQEEPNAIALTVDAIKKLLQDELSQTTKLATAQRNVDFAEQELAKIWGASTRQKLEARAKELDVSLDFLKGLAASKPKLFLETVGAKAPTQVNSQDYTPPQSRDNPAHREPAPGRNKAYYEKLRKENPNEYWSVRVQGQEMRDAIQLGDAFFV